MAYSRFPEPTIRTVEFASSGTWTCPSGVYSADFLVVGAGGGAGGSAASVNTRTAAGGGGGGGAVKKQTLAVTPGSIYTITIGAKGTGGTATAGTNGGFSEIVLSSVTLIRCYGGGGGAGTDATNSQVTATISPTLAGAGGGSLANVGSGGLAGGGGGAFGALFTNAATTYNENQYGTEGMLGRSGNSTYQKRLGMGGIGIDGFGNGGGGGAAMGGSGELDAGAAPYGAGRGANNVSAGAYNGSAATIAGCGGGGSLTYLATTSVTGGNGADGLVRITYVG